MFTKGVERVVEVVPGSPAKPQGALLRCSRDVNGTRPTSVGQAPPYAVKQPKYFVRCTLASTSCSALSPRSIPPVDLNFSHFITINIRARDKNLRPRRFHIFILPMLSTSH